MIEHGSYTKYTNDKCRCAACRKAWAEYYSQLRAKRRAWVTVNGLPSSVEHGLSAYLNWTCRCDVCRAAERASRP